MFMMDNHMLTSLELRAKDNRTQDKYSMETKRSKVTTTTESSATKKYGTESGAKLASKINHVRCLKR